MFQGNGRVTWNLPYIVQSMFFLLKNTDDEKWAAAIVDWGDSALGERDALSPVDKLPYAWIDRSDDVLAPYVWSGHTGHVFAPLMEFANYVLRHPELAARSHHDRSYREHALRLMREFTRALDVHMAELVDDGVVAYFRFAKPVPVTNKRINGQPLPVNMNSALFTAILYLGQAEDVSGRKDMAQRLSRLVAGFVRYLKDSVLLHQPCGGVTCILWRYATYIGRIEDVGHANNVVKFLVDAHENGYRITRADLIALSNTFDSLINLDGTFHANLLDGSSIDPPRSAIFYIILLIRYSPTLRVKLEHAVLESQNFSYWGPWLEASSTAEPPKAAK